jgi:hypothetical protein
LEEANKNLLGVPCNADLILNVVSAAGLEQLDIPRA